MTSAQWKFNTFSIFLWVHWLLRINLDGTSFGRKNDILISDYLRTTSVVPDNIVVLFDVERFYFKFLRQVPVIDGVSFIILVYCDAYFVTS